MRHFDKPKDKIRWAHIITAGGSVPDTTYLIKHRKRLTDLGWDSQELDIKGKKPAELRAFLADKDAINMDGGNSYFLIKCIRESGFADVLNEFLERGGVYCGSSAGAYVACPTIEQAGWKDPKKFNHHGVTDLTGMNLVPFIVCAHYRPEMKELLAPSIATAKYEVKILTDQQAIVVRDDEYEVITDPNIATKDYGG
ncbi:MAG: Type 1 glutamine amidotransferase-like domain-containing protein [Patescibacteria group bacterium]